MHSNQEEAVRLSALAKCRILDTGVEAAFDELIRLASLFTSCPMAMLSFVDRDRVWLKAALGLSRREFPRALAPCAAALGSPLFVVTDATLDVRFSAHPLVTQPPHVRFYAGASVHGLHGEAIGVLSVLDSKPREVSERDAEVLSMLARAASDRVALRLLRDERLLKSEALLSAAQRIAGIGSWEWDIRTNEGTWSDEMYSIFQRPRDYVPDLDSFLERIHPDERAGMTQKMAEVIAHGRTNFPEYRIIWPDGSVRIVVATAEIQRDQDGVPIRMTGALQDVTEQRRMEVERQQLATQMLRAQKLESLGLLAAGVAHDFNNLLVGVLGNAELALRDVTLSTPTRWLIDQVIEAASQAAGLTRQLLAYTGRRPFAMRNVDLATHVDRLSSLLWASLPKTTRLCLEHAPDLPSICADPDQLQQVTMNLILNAAEAYGAREGEVRVRTFLEEVIGPSPHALTVPGPPEPGRYVVLEVSDAGCGMDERTLERIFEPFFSTKFTGRGLGLAAVLGIVRGHEAVLSVDSAPGVGTTFRVYFPALAKGAAAPGEQAPAAGKAAPELSEPRADVLQNACVLVVDDEPRVRAVARAVLEGAQMRVIEANDGAQALALFARRGREIDVVLLDVIMPGADAATVLQELRAARPELPVVLCSGYPEDEETRLRRELAEERTAFLEKPFAPIQLLDKVRGVLATQPTQRDTDTGPSRS